MVTTRLLIVHAHDARDHLPPSDEAFEDVVRQIITAAVRPDDSLNRQQRSSSTASIGLDVGVKIGEHANYD